MKNVYLIGDMVRYSTDTNCGYGSFVMEELAGEAYVYSVQEDCRSAAHTLRFLHEWAQKAYVDPQEVDVVHWNNGLWDVARIMGDEPVTPVSVYQEQLIRIFRRIRQLFPNAKVIFAFTTPVMEEPDAPVWYLNSDIRAYNRAAAEALEPLGAEIDDLYAAAAEFGPEAYRTSEYFSLAGAQALGKAAAQAIRRLF